MKSNHCIRSGENVTTQFKKTVMAIQSLHHEWGECHVIIQDRPRHGDITDAPDTQVMQLIQEEWSHAVIIDIRGQYQHLV
jgi:hypothetical protein